ncbi:MULTISPECIES: hypothetical protein [unclassified Pseudoalteromonas]|uniref:hypothetical protein n=1 Tax=unclassified Pseudoalteromonas TaxID=194690 RepID=UPI0025B39DA8|nr:MULTISPECIES: hypothetical protein [unclassified Pseudoalteromonas]MDN3377022.1 hypothetical protein [Pseudoalteromonas sp. APC 3893]MDN3388528.1 hypothetical protein [Pseudoalteromonas sp. APC 4017]
MSDKINVSEIIKGHFSTLKNYHTGKICKSDVFVFIVIPLLIAIANMVFGMSIGKELRAALINFGAIFSALLISVLVLVYDQKNKLATKLENKSKDKESCQDNLPNLNALSTTLHELYSNICFAILTSLMLVVFSMVQIILIDLKITVLNLYLINPLIIFCICTIILTTLMIIKRLHKLLSAFDNIVDK